ncbi:hypothetical protein D3C85_1467770 [compost metagenome]
MTHITVVIEDHAEGIHLGDEMAGGRVVAAMRGDHSELLEALEDSTQYLQHHLPAEMVAPHLAAIAKART